jgi:hypothetical protein
MHNIPLFTALSPFPCTNYEHLCMRRAHPDGAVPAGSGARLGDLEDDGEDDCDGEDDNDKDEGEDDDSEEG